MEKHNEKPEQRIREIIGDICYGSSEPYKYGKNAELLNYGTVGFENDKYPICRKQWFTKGKNCSEDDVDKALKILKEKGIITTDEVVLTNVSDGITLFEYEHDNTYEIFAGKDEEVIFGNPVGGGMFQPSITADELINMYVNIFDELFPDRCTVLFATDYCTECFLKIVKFFGVENIKVTDEDKDGWGALVWGELPKQRVKPLVRYIVDGYGGHVASYFAFVARMIGYENSDMEWMILDNIEIMDKKDYNIKIGLIESAVHTHFEIPNQKYRKKFIESVNQWCNERRLKLYIKKMKPINKSKGGEKK